MWDYSDPAFSHLSLMFTHITGRQMSDYLQERIFAAIGIVWFHDSATFWRLFFLATLIGSLIGLKLVSPEG